MPRYQPGPARRSYRAPVRRSAPRHPVPLQNRIPRAPPRSVGNRVEDQLVRQGTAAALTAIPVVGPILAPLAPLVAPLVEAGVDAIGSAIESAFSGPSPVETAMQLVAQVKQQPPPAPPLVIAPAFVATATKSTLDRALSVLRNAL